MAESAVCPSTLSINPPSLSLNNETLSAALSPSGVLKTNDVRKLASTSVPKPLTSASTVVDLSPMTGLLVTIRMVPACASEP